jgi:hypothetical protein
MKPYLLSIWLVTFAIGTAIAAQKEKSTTVSDYPFWTSPKRGPVADFVPGLHAVLDLTDSQKQQIAAARDEMMNDNAVKMARGLSKTDPAVTADEREAARGAVEAANERMRRKVETILTVEQKALIENINGAYAAATQEVGGTYQIKVASAKIVGEERQRMQQQQRDEVDALFRRKLDEMLSAGQKSALAGAAANVPEKKSASK